MPLPNWTQPAPLRSVYLSLHRHPHRWLGDSTPGVSPRTSSLHCPRPASHPSWRRPTKKPPPPRASPAHRAAGGTSGGPPRAASRRGPRPAPPPSGRRPPRKPPPPPENGQSTDLRFEFPLPGQTKSRSHLRQNGPWEGRALCWGFDASPGLPALEISQHGPAPGTTSWQVPPCPHARPWLRVHLPWSSDSACRACWATGLGPDPAVPACTFFLP